MTRRVALQVVGTMVGYLYGREVVDAKAQVAQSERGSRGLAIMLDGVDGILLQYQGRRVIIQPVELMAALSPPIDRK